MEKHMTKLGLLGAAGVILSSALASPVTAQEVIYNPGYCAQFYPNANCQNKGPGNPDTDGRSNYRNSWNSSGDPGHAGVFAPAAAVAGIAAGAVGAAQGIQTAPRGSD